MKQIRKVLLIAVALIMCFGITSQASADLVTIDINNIFDLSLWNIFTPQTFNDPIIMNTSNILQASQLTFNNNFSALSPSIMNTASGVTFSNLSLLAGAPLAVSGNVTFNPGSLVALGYVTPTPHPPKDEMFAAIGIGATEAASLVALGYVTPTPHPPKDEMIGWVDNAIIVNGTLNLSNVMLNVDELVNSLSPTYGDNMILTLFGATGGIIGTPLLTGALAEQYEYFDPSDPNTGYETAGIRHRVPEPSTILLVGIGLLGFAVISIRQRKKIASK